MDLRLYDTKSRQLQALVPLKPGHVGIYLCGPTVQGGPHIGHLRAAVCFDVLIRWLEYNDQDITYIRNITDIDDKILNKAAEAGEEWWAWAARFEREFHAAYDTLDLLPPTYEPRATGHIPEQIALIERLIERGHGYADGNGNVYFSVASQPDYGSLTNQSPDAMRADPDSGSDMGKRDVRDFAMWKAAKPGEPQTASWDSPWGRGRPAWHLECSAMSHRYLGEAFDIHGGGIDLRFPHHENEQAQSHAAGWDFANLWVHNSWVTMANEKMSKSLGNVLSLDNLLQDYPAVVIRFALVTVHYRSMIEWSDETLPRAAQAWNKISSFVYEASELLAENASDLAGSVTLGLEQIPPPFAAAMNDDLNVALALAEIYARIKVGRQTLRDRDWAASAHVLSQVRSMLDVLGLDPIRWQNLGASQTGEAAAASDDPAGTISGSGRGSHRAMGALKALVGSVIERRQEARANKDWETSDKLRDQLKDIGILIEDGPDGPTWHLP